MVLLMPPSVPSMFIMSSTVKTTMALPQFPFQKKAVQYPVSFTHTACLSVLLVCPCPPSSLSLTAPIPSSSTNAASTSVPYCSPICMQIYARWIISAGLRAVALLTCPPVSTLVCAINSIGIVRLTNRSTNSAPLPSGFAHLLMCRNR